MLSYVDTKNNKYRIQLDNTNIKSGQHEAKILKNKKVVTFKNGVNYISIDYGIIKFEIKNNVLHLNEIELKYDTQKALEKFLEETEEDIIDYFTKLCDYNSIKELNVFKIVMC